MVRKTKTSTQNEIRQLAGLPQVVDVSTEVAKLVEALPILTELEQDVLDGCYRSEYTDGTVRFAIWSWSCAPRKAGVKQVSGVVSSLVKKGIVTCGGEGTKDDDNTIDVTPLGIEVARSLGFFEVRESDGMELYNPDHADNFRPALNKKVAGPSAAEIKVAVSKLVKELGSNAAAINKVLETEGPEELKELMSFSADLGKSKFQAAGNAIAKALKTRKAATQSKAKDTDMIVVKVGWGIEQVMQLDDAGVCREFGLEIMNDFNTKSTMVLKATRKDLINFRNACADRISSQYDQPLWYMSSAKATVAKIDAALGGK